MFDLYLGILISRVWGSPLRIVVLQQMSHVFYFTDASDVCSPEHILLLDQSSCLQIDFGIRYARCDLHCVLLMLAFRSASVNVCLYFILKYLLGTCWREFFCD